MSDVKWSLEGRFVEFCNCELACPCDGTAAPTHGHCNGVLAMAIDKGRYGDTPLDGFKLVALYHFPGAMHDCDGHLHPILPEGTSDEARDAVFKILSGSGQPMGTIFDLFGCLIEHDHKPIYKPIAFDWDIEARTSRIEVPGVLSAATAPTSEFASDAAASSSEPPQGLMLNSGAIGSGSVESTVGIELKLSNCHSSLAYFEYNDAGVNVFSQEPR